MEKPSTAREVTNWIGFYTFLVSTPVEETEVVSFPQNLTADPLPQANRSRNMTSRGALATSRSFHQKQEQNHGSARDGTACFKLEPASKHFKASSCRAAHLNAVRAIRVKQKWRLSKNWGICHLVTTIGLNLLVTIWPFSHLLECTVQRIWLMCSSPCLKGLGKVLVCKTHHKYFCQPVIYFCVA